jgi:hypothetical protein
LGSTPASLEAGLAAIDQLDRLHEILEQALAVASVEDLSESVSESVASLRKRTGHLQR